jgi:hypothetical protein
MSQGLFCFTPVWVKKELFYNDVDQEQANDANMIYVFHEAN